MTIYDIAKASGFSTATVSLVLHGDPRVRESTKERIIACMKDMNYNPSYLASSLASQRTNNIGVVIPTLRNPVFAEMLEGAESFLQNENYNVIIGVTNQDMDKERHYLDFISHQKIDGLILFPTFLHELRETYQNIQNMGFPLVICGIRVEGIAGMNYVSSNVVEGAYLATESLIKRGHRHICLVSGVASSDQADDRISGYKRALTVYGLPYQPEYVLQLSPDLQTIRKTCYDFLGEHPEVTAFFCLYDYIAFAAMKGIYDRGLRIPQDIAVVGYDDIELNRYLPIELSSVHTNSRRVGETAARIIVNQLKNANTDLQQIILPPRMIERASSNWSREDVQMILSSQNAE